MTACPQQWFVEAPTTATSSAIHTPPLMVRRALLVCLDLLLSSEPGIGRRRCEVFSALRIQDGALHHGLRTDGACLLSFIPDQDQAHKGQDAAVPLWKRSGYQTPPGVQVRAGSRAAAISFSLPMVL